MNGIFTDQIVKYYKYFKLFNVNERMNNLLEQTSLKKDLI
jgi:hypothetical protein